MCDGVSSEVKGNSVNYSRKIGILSLIRDQRTKKLGNKLKSCEQGRSPVSADLHTSGHLIPNSIIGYHRLN